jgi:hypothetical protein
MKSNKTILVTGHLAIISFAQNFNRIGRGCCGSLCWAVFSLLPRKGRIATDTAANKDLKQVKTPLASHRSLAATCGRRALRKSREG